jgi:c(7)-type cytochrome triheme protein
MPMHKEVVRRDTVAPWRSYKTLGGVALLVLLMAGGALVFLRANQAQAAQTAPTAQPPVVFSHKTMVGIGINCVFCHSGAMKSPVAGVPSVQKCMGCHAVIAADKPEIQKLAAYWQRHEPIPWPRVNTLPRFVYFSHQVHVTAGGVNCERCHGDVSQMALAQPVVKMNMGWCLDCHNQQPNADQLKDCSVCHK